MRHRERKKNEEKRKREEEIIEGDEGKIHATHFNVFMGVF